MSAGELQRRLDRLAWLLDSSIRIPIVNRRIGVDALLGLIPGVGDALGGLLSTYIIYQGVRIRAPLATVIHMIGNVAVEVVVGFVPLLGDLFDMGWKANQRNVALLGDYLERPASATHSRRLLFAIAVFLVLAAISSVALGVLLLTQLVAWIF